MGEGKVEEWTPAELKNFLIAIITDSDPPPLIVLIDALDEGNESDVRNMLAFFEGAQDHAYATDTPLRICFSSRHYPHITIRAGLEIVVEDQTGQKTDMMRYIRENLHGDQSPSMDELRQKVQHKSGGIFLWVVLVVPMLNIVFDRGKSLEEASKRLEDIPEELDALFVEILAKSDEDVDDCVSLLQWVVFAMESLTPQQLYLALLYSKAASPVGRPTVPEFGRLAKYLLHCSRGLIEVTKSDPPQVQFIHETIRSFLLSGRGLVKVQPQLRIGFEGSSHDKLKEACLQCILNESPKQVLRPYLEPSQDQKQDAAYHIAVPPRLLRYAACHILQHADIAQRCGRSQLEFVAEIDEDRHFASAKLMHSHLYYLRNETSATTPLQAAAEHNLIDLVRCFIHRRNDIDGVSGDDSCALYLALCKGHLQMVQLLLDRGRNTDTTGSVSDAFGGAVPAKQMDIAQLLLERGVDVEAGSKHWDSALQYASDMGNLPVVKLLLDRGVGIRRSAFLHDALQKASSSGHIEVVQLLLNKGADVNYSNGVWGTSTLQAASRHGHQQVVELLLKHGAK